MRCTVVTSSLCGDGVTDARVTMPTVQCVVPSHGVALDTDLGVNNNTTLTLIRGHVPSVNNRAWNEGYPKACEDFTITEKAFNQEKAQIRTFSVIVKTSLMVRSQLYQPTWLWTWTPTTGISRLLPINVNMLVVSQKTSGKNKDIVMSKIVSFHFKKFYRI